MEYYSITTIPMDEKGNPLHPGINGGLYKKEQLQQQPVNYIHVESVDEYSKKIIAFDGKIIVPKMAIPSMGWFALAQDPEGHTFGIFEEMQM